MIGGPIPIFHGIPPPNGSSLKKQQEEGKKMKITTRRLQDLSKIQLREQEHKHEQDQKRKKI